MTADPIRSAPIDVPQAALDDLRRRLRATRWPERETAPDWSQGVPLDAMRDLARYWADAYDWRRCEARLNGWNPSVTAIDGVDIHFLHIRSPEPDALPVLMIHGWPGSVLEFAETIGPLTDPRAHGGDPADAVHLVLPSLPGYGFSGKPEDAGWGPEHIARAFGALMSRLGYGQRWVAQGGDWGSFISTAIGQAELEGCIGLHLNFLSVPPTEEEKAAATAAEQRWIRRIARYDEDLSGYNREQATRPQTLGYALADSPTGQAAWIYEKFQDWTDNRGTPETALDRDAMLDTISLYWLTNSGASSGRLYWNRAQSRMSEAKVRLPTAFSIFPHDIRGGSERWAARQYERIVRFRELERGGHFAAFEVPDLFVAELREGLRAIRAAGDGSTKG